MGIKLSLLRQAVEARLDGWSDWTISPFHPSMVGITDGSFTAKGLGVAVADELESMAGPARQKSGGDILASTPVSVRFCWPLKGGSPARADGDAALDAAHAIIRRLLDDWDPAEFSLSFVAQRFQLVEGRAFLVATLRFTASHYLPA